MELPFQELNGGAQLRLLFFKTPAHKHTSSHKETVNFKTPGKQQGIQQNQAVSTTDAVTDQQKAKQKANETSLVLKVKEITSELLSLSARPGY